MSGAARLKSIIAATAPCLAPGLAAAALVPADAPPPPVRQLMFHCHVEAGPKLAACQAKAPGDLDPRKVANLKAAVENTPPCLLGGAVPGTALDRALRFQDSPALLNPPRGDRHVVINPDWAERPSAALFAKFYPAAAKAAHISGHVVLDCKVKADGAAPDCAVAQETPAGQGFGAAALSASASFRFRPMMVDCKPTDGGRIRIPLNFNGQ